MAEQKERRRDLFISLFFIIIIIIFLFFFHYFLVRDFGVDFGQLEFPETNNDGRALGGTK